jgi:hypothetical protein
MVGYFQIHLCSSRVELSGLKMLTNYLTTDLQMLGLILLLEQLY